MPFKGLVLNEASVVEFLLRLELPLAKPATETPSGIADDGHGGTPSGTTAETPSVTASEAPSSTTDDGHGGTPSGIADDEYSGTPSGISDNGHGRTPSGITNNGYGGTPSSNADNGHGGLDGRRPNVQAAELKSEL